MKEIIDNFWTWYHSLNLGEILNWIITIGVPTFIAILTKKLNKSQIKEIRAVAENKKISANFIEATNNILDNVLMLENTIKTLAKNNEMLNQMMMILLANANISADAKEKAIGIYKDAQTKISNDIQVSEENTVVLLDKVEQQIEEEKVQEQQPTELDKLVNSFKS